jgi:hypothetical protein
MKSESWRGGILQRADRWVTREVLSHVMLGEMCDSIAGQQPDWLYTVTSWWWRNCCVGQDRACTVSWYLHAPEDVLRRRGVAPLVLKCGTASGWEISFTTWPVWSGEENAWDYYFILSLLGEMFVVGSSSFQMHDETAWKLHTWSAWYV